jgi:hypothetical protein
MDVAVYDSTLERAGSRASIIAGGISLTDKGFGRQRILCSGGYWEATT